MITNSSLLMRGGNIALEGRTMSLTCAQPITATVLKADGSLLEVSSAYESVVTLDDGFFECAGTVELSAGSTLQFRDLWSQSSAGAVVDRRVQVVGGSPDVAFSTSILVEPDRGDGWADVEPFIPGVAYGNAEKVATSAVAGIHSRRAGVRTILVREDRLSAPVYSHRYSDGAWLAVMHLEPDAETVFADGEQEFGDENLIDSRLRYVALGGGVTSAGLSVGAIFPGTEGEITYSSGRLPLVQLNAWRRRFHPVEDGASQHYRVEFALGETSTTQGFIEEVWRMAWNAFTPSVHPVAVEQVARESLRVLADQATTVGKLTGIALEADAVVPDRRDEDNSAIMGFVGANTDAAYLLLRQSILAGEPTARYRELGERVLDSFAAIPMNPPAAEGFDTSSGEFTTYRTFEDRPAVYVRSLAEGGMAMLEAVRWVTDQGETRPHWLAWARQIGSWFLSQQHPNGSMPRAWVAGTGEVLDDSDSASYIVAPFLFELARQTGQVAYSEAALKAAEYGWRLAGPTCSYAGATLDNPDVVDKEAAILSAEAYLAAFDETATRVWLERAQAAAAIAETWIYLWNVPMPADAPEDLLHWKRGVPTVGHQLIATGVSMTDGFLASNAAVFARLFLETGDDHWLRVARIVVHGTTGMMALDGRVFDLRGPGWQQEHWSFAPRRGFGLNRRWLPWVPVAHVRGIRRIRDLGPDVASLVFDV